jgi:hypothetical protein
VRRNIPFWRRSSGTGEESTARFASTPLVLDSYAPDFSTEAGNSDLIADNEISTRLRSAAKQKQQQAGFQNNFRLAYQGEARHVTE